MGKVLYLPVADTGKANSEAIRQAMKPRRRRWNWRRAAGNLLTLLALIAVGWWAGLAMLLPWWTGSSW